MDKKLGRWTIAYRIAIVVLLAFIMAIQLFDSGQITQLEKELNEIRGVVVWGRPTSRELEEAVNRMSEYVEQLDAQNDIP